MVVSVLVVIRWGDLLGSFPSYPCSCVLGYVLGARRNSKTQDASALLSVPFTQCTGPFNQLPKSTLLVCRSGFGGYQLREYKWDKLFIPWEWAEGPICDSCRWVLGLREMEYYRMEMAFGVGGGYSLWVEVGGVWVGFVSFFFIPTRWGDCVLLEVRRWVSTHRIPRRSTVVSGRGCWTVHLDKYRF